MKTLLTTLLCIAVLSLHAQVHKDVLKETLNFEKQSKDNVLYITNLNGGIEVVGYEGTEIQLEVDRTIRAKTEDRLQKGIKETSIGILDRYDTLVVYMEGGCENFYWDKNDRENGPDWDYNYKNCNRPYDYKFDIRVKVPRGQNIYLSTVNRGNILVNGVSGTLELRNINGDIQANDIVKSTVIHSINGDVTLNYTEIPTSGEFYSLNGDINANYPKGFKASVIFKSFNGDFFTNIDDYESKSLFTTSEASGKGIKFKAESKSAIIFRGGGPELDFETFNGNVYIKENK